ncbi:hypothetical protein FBU59_000091 [Linderina macrospora]|uniref:Uncharacterized protein n=1 Tax=Linderina macrospora TaxID=4868 RepID=A0ACC1JHU6_9FUNG|nr:hypothetical protein FBU59_000091 [Linderina macrospora]
MVASTQPLANQAGVRILEQGGNAADAAVAVAAAINLAEPFSTGIGGDCFCLFYNAKDKSIRGLNGSGRAPAGLTIDVLRDRFGISGDEVPARSVHAVTVPGAAAGWVDTVEAFGSGKLTLAEILQPAIEMCEEGVPVGELTSPFWRDGAEFLKRTTPNAHELLIHGQGPLPGQVFRNPKLASTFRKLASEGKQGFYSGSVADAIIEAVQSKGGLLTHADLAAHTTTFDDPISYEYRGHRLHECAPNGSGLVALMALGVLEQLEKQGAVGDMEHNSAEYLHMIIEILRIAFADARQFVCDPAFHAVPVEQMLNPEYLKQRAALFDSTRAAIDVRHGSPLGGSDTVYFTVVDKDGNACSFINSLYHGFGSGIIPRGCGFALHDRGALFRLDPAHPNCLEPNKRPYHTIIPAMVTKGGDLFMTYGIMGGYNQPQAHVQVLLNMVLFGMNPQQALDSSRICILVDEEGVVAVEEGVGDEVVARLRQMGHNVKVERGLQRSQFGRGQIIRRTIDEAAGMQVLVAGSDPRSDGQAVGR